jgi:hypothetical protein
MVRARLPGGDTLRHDSLADLRERALQMVETRPAEVSPEMEWLVSELERNKEVLLALIDHMMNAEM